ncbi:hypothetical protein [Zhihengliuella flava]|uniref:Uncharacterized protein n=1 Tax=Zhihengliuella flava TaxID=1285193 RepID=A0A931DC62_9MICC|nr:hypothetical protein [Zhihengliuella flava]MBG6084731.1 hypothetical protein [Zhihengliuella flava]
MLFRRVEHQQRGRWLDAGAGFAGEKIDRLQHGGAGGEGLEAVASLGEAEHRPDGGGLDKAVLDDAGREVPGDGVGGNEAVAVVSAHRRLREALLDDQREEHADAVVELEYLGASVALEGIDQLRRPQEVVADLLDAEHGVHVRVRDGLPAHALAVRDRVPQLRILAEHVLLPLEQSVGAREQLVERHPIVMPLTTPLLPTPLLPGELILDFGEGIEEPLGVGIGHGTAPDRSARESDGDP